MKNVITLVAITIIVGKVVATMYRYIIKDLEKWKNSSRRKPLMLTGVRQCGKTYILKEFGKKYNPGVGYKTSLKNIAQNDIDGTRTISLPLYLLWNMDFYNVTPGLSD